MSVGRGWMDETFQMHPDTGAEGVGAPRRMTPCPGAPRDTWGEPGLVGIYGAWDSAVRQSGPVPTGHPNKESVILNGGVA